MNEQDIKDKLTRVCLCIGVNKLTIKNAIRNGAQSIQDIQKATYACTGGCKASRCGERVKELIETYKMGEWD